MLTQGLCPASEPHVLTTKHLAMDPVIQCGGNPLELALVAASLSQFLSFSTHKVVCVSPLDSVALAATVSIIQWDKTLDHPHIVDIVHRLEDPQGFRSCTTSFFRWK